MLLKFNELSPTYCQLLKLKNRIKMLFNKKPKNQLSIQEHVENCKKITAYSLPCNCVNSYITDEVLECIEKSLDEAKYDLDGNYLPPDPYTSSSEIEKISSVLDTFKD